MRAFPRKRIFPPKEPFGQVRKSFKVGIRSALIRKAADRLALIAATEQP